MPMRKDDSEFKQNVVKKVTDEQPIASVSRELGVNESPIHSGNANQSKTIKIQQMKKRNYPKGMERESPARYNTYVGDNRIQFDVPASEVLPINDLKEGDILALCLKS